jgi:hypothetical protein
MSVSHPSSTAEELIERARQRVPDALGRLLESYRNYIRLLASKHSPKGWIGRELIWRRLSGCSIAEHYESFACGTDCS